MTCPMSHIHGPFLPILTRFWPPQPFLAQTHPFLVHFRPFWVDSRLCLAHPHTFPAYLHTHLAPTTCLQARLLP